MAALLYLPVICAPTYTPNTISINQVSRNNVHLSLRKQRICNNISINIIKIDSVSWHRAIQICIAAQ
jgi:hypothetical protein